MKSLTKKTGVGAQLWALWLLSMFLVLGSVSNAQTCERLVWQDEFDGPNLDLNKWGYETGDGCPNLCQWGTGQLDYATDRPENVRIENGRLILELRKENYGGREYTSGRIRTYKKANFRYGRIEAKVKGVYSQGAGFAFWMLGSNFETVSWPKCGEVDIFEQTGKFPDMNIGTTHFQESWGHSWNQGKLYLPNGQRFADAFHTVGLEWTPDSMRWYIDGVYYHTFYISKPINNYDPFNRDFFLILSAGMGGDYSGAPDATTVTPQKIEVEYVRVYEGAYSTYIDGERKVYEGDKNVEYTTKALSGATYNWSVPTGSTIVSGQGSNKIVVNFGNTSGKVILNLTAPNCAAQTYSKDVEVQKAIIVDKVYDDFETKRNCTYDYRSGTLTQPADNPASNYINSSTKVAKYVRNVAEAWDAIVMLNVDPGHAGEFVQGKKRLFLDVYTDAPIGTKVSLGFENSLVATPEYPYGKHSNYAAYTTKQNAWQRLEFLLSDIPDKYAGAYKVNKFVLMFDPGIKSGNTWYFDNLRSGQSGTDAPVLSQTVLENWDGTSILPIRSATGLYQPNTANPSAVVNTSPKVLKYTRSSATIYDNLTYKIQLDDASLFRDGTNTLSFDVYTNAAPGKVISVHFEDSTISGAADWQAPIHSIYEGRIEKQNQWQTIEFKCSSTPNASVPNVNVNKLVFLIDENTSTGDVYYIDNIRINSRNQPESYILNKIIEDFDANKNLTFVYSGEDYAAPVANPAPTGINTSANAARIIRHDVNANDWLVYDLKTTIDAKALREKTKVFAMDVYTNAPLGKVITIGLEAGSIANSSNWPTGRHSDYSTAIKAQNQWHTVRFIYSSSADPSTPDALVNKLTFTFNQGQPGNYTYYFDNFRVLESVKETVLYTIDVNPVLSQNIALNQTIQFAATGKDQFGKPFATNPVWSVNGGGTISSTGLFKATVNGVYKVSAVDGNVIGNADILIGESIKLSKIILSPASSTIYQGGSVQLTAAGYDQLSKPYTISSPAYTISPSGATITNGLFTSNTPGDYTVTISSSGVSATATVKVRATPVLTTLAISPLESKMFNTASLQFSATSRDQYGDNITVPLIWTSTGGSISSAGLFTSTTLGTYVVKVQSGDKQASTFVSVIETPVNVALNKPITASSEENYGVVATYANDGNATTRWSSVNTDNQWIKIDLQNIYKISSVVLNWEAAFGKSYDIKISGNGTDYTTIASETNGSAGKKSYNLNATTRYIMIQGITRGTTYGYSLYEFEVYGVINATSVLKSIVVTPNYTEVNQNATQQYACKAFDQFGNIMSISPSWSTTGGSVNSAGLYTASAIGTFNITATSGSVSGIAQIKVKGNAAPTVSISAPINNQVFQKGTNVAITASAADGDGSVSKVEFYYGNTLLTTLTAAPYSYTWNAPVAGTYDLTAKAIDNMNAATTSTAVRIKVNNPPTVTISSPASGTSYAEGATITVTATATDADGTVTKLEFYVDNALKGTVTASPYSISITGLTAGTHTLFARATDNDGGIGNSGNINLTITPSTTDQNIALLKPITCSTLEGGLPATNANDGNAGTRWGSAFADPQWIAVDLQGTFNISKVVLNWEAAAGKVYNIETSNDNTNWTSIKSQAEGAGGIETYLFTGITAKYIRMYGTQRTTGYGYSLWEFEVYGSPVNTTIPVTGVTVAPTSLSLAVNATSQLTATVAPGNATNKTVNWTSSNTTVATVSTTGLVTAKAVGTATITVTTQDGNKTATCAVNVTSGTISVTGVTVAPTTLSLAVNATSQLTATVAPSNATNKAVSWTSSNTTIATVSTTGLVTAKAVGAATITVTTQDGNKTSFCTVNVTSGTVSVTGVTIAPTSVSLTVNATSQLTATVAPSNATNKTVSWISSNTAVATVSATGLVTAKAVGAATITVTTQDGNKTATSTINVTNNNTNIALGKPVTASTTQSGLPVTNVNDGNNTTRWGSEWADPQWITIDLQASYSITKVVLNWETACGKSYTVDVSTDNVNWTNIYTTTTGAPGVNTITPSVNATGRYIRMRGTVRATGWGYSLYEFEVYGSAAAASAKSPIATIISQKETINVKYYPNPVSDMLTIVLDENEFERLIIMDVTGRIVLQQNIEKSSSVITQDLSMLKNGAYVMKLGGSSVWKEYTILKK